MGTWQTFDAGPSKFDALREVLQTMKNSGARLLDSSPMYGRAEQVTGILSQELGAENFFYATKVWTEGRTAGIQQMEDSMKKMQRSSLDLIQVHNLVDWKTHLDTLKEWKASGRTRYIGITHYTNSMHEALEKIISTVAVDFVQFNYSISSRNAEKRLLPASAHHGVATLINRPLDEGKLFQKTRGKKLPEWCHEIGVNNWTEFFLKFILSHPAVTCVIPATADRTHATENFQSGLAPLPDELTRNRMAHWFDAL
jgi:diketogulonate reductase-like aldo/keto reductase